MDDLQLADHPTDWLIDWPTDFLADLLTDWLAGLLTGWLDDWHSTGQMADILDWLQTDCLHMTAWMTNLLNACLI